MSKQKQPSSIQDLRTSTTEKIGASETAREEADVVLGDSIKNSILDVTSLPVASSTATTLSSQFRKKASRWTTPMEKKKQFRTIWTNQQQSRKFCNNAITSGKYTFLTFLPKFLYEQFRRYSNIFFLTISILQQIDNISPTGRQTTAIPFAFILTVSAIKEIAEDVKRHRSDRVTNRRSAKVFKNGSVQTVTWKELQVGDFVLVENNDLIPCDLVLYSTSEHNGICYVETSNLDGETNLKIRQAIPATSETNKENLFQIQGYIICEEPNRNLYEFFGKLSVSPNQEHPLGPDQILLRGSKVKNTAWAIAQVIYTGRETKLRKNANKAPLKQSTLDKKTNQMIFLLFILLLILVTTCSMLSLRWTKVITPSMWYLPQDTSEEASYTYIFTFFTFIILLNNMIPISLTVTLELVRYIQAKFIEKDLDMYYKDTDTPAVAKTSNLNEELGIIQHIFSDKTGTLTKNVMVFKGCSIKGEMYTEETLGAGQTSALVNKIKNHHAHADAIHEFLLLLAVCHGVIPDSSTGQLIYHASSPDERALVLGAKDHGFSFQARTPTSCTISIKLDQKPPKIQVYEILHMLEFNSDRKRMSVIVRTPERKLKLFCKGADSIIYDRISKNNDPEMQSATQKHINSFSKLGLRTLCLATRELREDEYTKWATAYQAALVSTEDHDRRIAEQEDIIEKDLILIGATAIEDKLQDKVPQTIKLLLQASIRIWVLTGDKEETAIDIGRSCNLITPNMALYSIKAENKLDTYKAINKHLSGLRKEYGASLTEDVNAAVVIDGKTLNYATDKGICSDFVTLCTICRVVICCRATPFQKAEIVHEVTKRTGAITLAIGDGANDVAMIQRAHVGVGIAGVEGLQAASSADYALGQFLLKLLLVHGAWDYNRISKVVLYCFYKNILLFVILLWYAGHNGYSGQIIFDRWILSLYNVMFTASQPMAIGLFEKKVLASQRLRYPRLYLENQSSFSMKMFIAWVFVSICQSISIFLFSVWTVGDGVVWGHGRDSGYIVTGYYIFTYIIIIASLKAAIELKSWTIFSNISIWGSILFWFAFLPVYDYICSVFPIIGSESVGVTVPLYSAPTFWLGIPVIILICYVPEITLNVFQLAFANESEEELRREEYVYLQERISIEKTIFDASSQTSHSTSI